MGKTFAGRASVFRGKAGGVRVQGILTQRGGAAFERRRRELQRLYLASRGHLPTAVSDADVIEFLALGFEETRDYLARV